MGDADGNGVVNVMDIQIIKKCVVNTDFAENYTDTADINEDGEITSVDILMLKKIITNGEV
ncbi:MAG: dockerin type I repeat-containing protein [Acutalibacteraceae bacterium]|nr:dockerin type I repeat-containing protein [Acutalibacteraceae bacterium]